MSVPANDDPYDSHVGGIPATLNIAAAFGQAISNGEHYEKHVVSSSTSMDYSTTLSDDESISSTTARTISMSAESVESLRRTDMLELRKHEDVYLGSLTTEEAESKCPRRSDWFLYHNVATGGLYIVYRRFDKGNYEHYPIVGSTGDDGKRAISVDYGVLDTVSFDTLPKLIKYYKNYSFISHSENGEIGAEVFPAHEEEPAFQDNKSTDDASSLIGLNDLQLDENTAKSDEVASSCSWSSSECKTIPEVGS